MRKKNGGFTLIELMIAIAVLSTMAAVLFQTFVVSRRMDTKARKDEVLQDLAKRTMEEMKGFSLETLDRIAAENDDIGSGGGTEVQIAGKTYQWSPLSEAESGGISKHGYTLSRAVGRNLEADSQSGPAEGRAKTESGTKTESEKGAYVLQVRFDRRNYNKDGGAETGGGAGGGSAGGDSEEDEVYSINGYRMPNIADVSSFQNVVLDPGMIKKDDVLCIAQLLLKANQAANDNARAAYESTAEEGAEEYEDQDFFFEKDIKRYLDVKIEEKNGGGDPDTKKLAVTATAVYKLESGGGAAAGLDERDKTLSAPLISAERQVVKDGSGKPANRIYLFPPSGETAGGATGQDQVQGPYFVTITVNDGKTGETGEDSTEDKFELYVAAPTDIADAGSGNKRSDYIKGGRNPGDPAEGGIEVYTNLEYAVGEKGSLVSLDDARYRMSRITVAIYEADYSSGTATNPGPFPGEELIRLESTKKD